MNNVNGLADGLFLAISTTSATPLSTMIKSGNNLLSLPINSSLPRTLSFGTNLMVFNSEYSNRHKGIKVTSGNKISVLVLNLLRGSYGEYLAYPCHDLGLENYTYIAVSTTSQLSTAHSQILLVGCQDNTIIVITPTKQVELPWNVQVANGSMLTIKGGESHTFILNEQQTLVLRSKGDLTGTKIVSDKPLTVVSGHECGNIPQSFRFCEHLTVQIPPTATWGTDFLLVPFVSRSRQIYQITRVHSNTTVVFKYGSQTRLVRSSQLHLLSENAHCSLSADKPIFVAKLAEGGERDEIGDPTVSVVPPVQQYINSVSLFVYPRSLFRYNYIGVTVNSRHFSHDSILLDSRPINCTWKALDSSNGTLGHACTLPIESGFHTMRHKHKNGSFSVIVYGYHESRHQAYAYNAGMKLNVLTHHNQAGI